MCNFDVASIDPVAFAYCSLRLGLVYESVVYHLQPSFNVKGELLMLTSNFNS